MAMLPEYLQEQTEEAIRSRMLGRVPGDVDKAEGSFIWDALAPAALELYAAAGWAQETLRRGFASTTFGAYLDLRCEEHGLTRRPAVKATGTVKFTGASGAVVPAGTRLATPADSATNSPSVEFETAAEAVLDAGGEAEVGVTAVDAGAAGNVAAGAISLLAAPIPGVTAVTNPAATSGGVETESDAALLERYLLKVRSPGTSGNKADYMKWALDVPGVGGVRVEPLWNGPGTVRVFILNTEKRAPSAELVDEVQQYISPTAATGEGLAPIGAQVTVSPAVEAPIDISVRLTLAGGADLEEVRTIIEQGVRGYLQQIAFADPLVRTTRIAAILLDISPIVDFSDLTLNGDEANVEIQPGQVAVVGTVSVYE